MADIAPIHHPDEDVLLEYAAGKASQATSVMVATHLALCPTCRVEVRRLEALGGALVEAERPVAMSAGALTAVLSRLDEADEVIEAPADMCDPETRSLIPQPLRGYLGNGLDALPWRTRGIGIREAALDLGDPSIRTSLVRIAPGCSVLGHTHGDIETTMVLKGAFNDTTGRYARGDVAVATADLDHAPVAEADEECICLIIVEGGLKFTGPLSRLMNPFVRF
ncbi:MAG: ChrR family anti-sigma-E factor [Thalassobaculaceae bacterium]